MTKIVLRRSGNERPDAAGSIKGLSRLLASNRLIRPHFSQCWTSDPSPETQVVAEYHVEDASVRVSTASGSIRHSYCLTPWEYQLPDRLLRLLNEAIGVVSTRPPENIGGGEGALRQHVESAARLYISETARRRALPLGESPEETNRLTLALAKIASRYTIGLGIFELLLADHHVEDVYLDAPVGRNPVHVTVSGLEGESGMLRCTTNITATDREVSGIVSRLRQYSGRPFSEAFPILETEVRGFNARATAIGPPLSPHGTAVAMRRHSSSPWTLLRLAHIGTIDALTAGLISFLVDGRSSILVCGPRGAGKSAMLSAILFELPTTHRILTIEDTAELPVRQMQELGYKVQSLLVEQRPGDDRDAKTEEALRVSLRLGESAIVVGEVRGREAQVLYDSMRTGKAGSSVLGTIHGDSARSVYERVVHDMGIAGEAFQATDVVLTMGLTRPGGTQRQVRKMVEMAETSKQRGPGEFNSLIDLDSGGVGPRALRDRSETVAKIAASWNIDYGEAMENIRTRAELRSLLLAKAAAGSEECLGASWTCRLNEFFWRGIEAGDTGEDIIQGFHELLGG
jgi:flagellar protein FlaI